MKPESETETTLTPELLAQKFWNLTDEEKISFHREVYRLFAKEMAETIFSHLELNK